MYKQIPDKPQGWMYITEKPYAVMKIQDPYGRDQDAWALEWRGELI